MRFIRKILDGGDLVEMQWLTGSADVSPANLPDKLVESGLRKSLDLSEEDYAVEVDPVRVTKRDVVGMNLNGDVVLVSILNPQESMVGFRYTPKPVTK